MCVGELKQKTRKKAARGGGGAAKLINIRFCENLLNHLILMRLGFYMAKLFNTHPSHRARILIQTPHTLIHGTIHSTRHT